MSYDLHVVRTKDWLQAAEQPISRDEIDKIIQSDPELDWSCEDYVDMKNGGSAARYFMITWRGDSRFWWYQDQIICASADDATIKKLAQIARELKAYVIGDDGEEYVLERDFLRRWQIKIVQSL